MVCRFRLLVWVCGLVPALAGADGLDFRVQEIETALGIGYAVRLLDIDADSRLDIVVVDKTRVVWYANPTWERHTILEGNTKPDNVCLAPHDIDGDGKIDLALGADWNPSNTRSGGTLQWLRQGANVRDPWSVHPIGEEPTVHRIGWVDIDADPKPELVVVPLFGRATTRETGWNERGLRVLAYDVPSDPVRERWYAAVLNDDLHVAHNFWPADLDEDGESELLVASFEGVSWLRRRPDGPWSRRLLGAGNQATKPHRGASEVKLGILRGPTQYIATIEPWHGFQVVVYLRPSGWKPADPGLWERRVLDEELQWGHAVWCADLDGDADQELIIGVRDDRDPMARRGVRIYDPAEGGARWQRYLVDPGGVAIEDLAAADLDGDGLSDIVAVGRQTQNIRIYWNQSRPRGGGTP